MSVVHRLPVIVAKSLLIDITEQMKGAGPTHKYPASTGSPEVLQPIRVDIAVDGRFEMVDYAMLVLIHLPAMGVFVAVGGCSSFDVLTNVLLHSLWCWLIALWRTG